MGRRSFANLLLGLALLAIAAATLLPASSDPRSRILCLLCGTRGLADAILNTLLFAPLGAALRYRQMGAPRAIILAFGLSVVLELVQAFLPGRDPTLGDVVFNNLGAAVGWLCLQWPHALHELPPRRAARFAIVGFCAAFGVIVTASIAMKPDFPTSMYYSVSSPEPEDVNRYAGEAIYVSVGELRIRFPPSSKTAEIPARILSGVPVNIALAAGPPAMSLKPITKLYDDRNHEVLLLAAHHNDLVFGIRSLGAKVRLDRPLMRFRHVLGSVEPGDTTTVSLRRSAAGFCLDIKGRRVCEGFTAADGWQVLLAHNPRSRFVASAINFVWLMVLFAPTGYMLVRRRGALVAGAGVAFGLVFAFRATGVMPPTAVDFVAVWTGLAVGWCARRFFGAQIHAATTDAIQRSIRA